MELPQFPEQRELALEHRETVQHALRTSGSQISEFTFSNLYLFRKAHSYRLSRLGDFLIVTGKGYDGAVYSFPPLGAGPVGEASLRVCDGLAAEGHEPVFFPVPDALLAHYPGLGWSAASDRDQADYVYSREELATLPGKKYHKRRNRLLKFIREEAEGYAYAPLADEHVPGCVSLAQAWCEIRCSPARPSTYLETQAAEEAVRCRSELGLTGAVVLIGGKVAAFTLGEELNGETFVVHFEKSETDREGLAQLMSREFCLHGLERYRYVNREQDLGDPGLRQAKEQYNPVFLMEKYRVRPR